MSERTISIDPKADRRASRYAMPAVTFRESPYLEGILAELRTNPSLELAPQARMALYLYQQEKAQAEAAAQLRIQ